DDVDRLLELDVVGALDGARLALVDRNEARLRVVDQVGDPAIARRRRAAPRRGDLDGRALALRVRRAGEQPRERRPQTHPPRRAAAPSLEFFHARSRSTFWSL